MLCGDFFKLSPSDLPEINAVYDYKAIIALPLEMRKKYIEHLLFCTGKKIKILLMSMEASTEVTGPPFSVSDHEIHTLFSEHFSIRKLSQEMRTDFTEHLIKKGYIKIVKTLYLMTKRIV